MPKPLQFSLYPCFILFLLVDTSLFADNYPKNLGIDVLNYSFDLTLSDNSNKIFGKATISIEIIKEGQARIRLDLINRSQSPEGKGMLVETIKTGDKPMNFQHKNNELFIDLPPNLRVGDIVKLTSDYNGVPADGLRIGENKYGDRGFFSENWPTRARHWLPVIDHPYEKATSEFIVKAPAKYSVISNGLKQEESIIGLDLKLTHWKQSVPLSSWLYVLGVGKFAIQFLERFEGRSIETWVYPQDRDIGFEKFSTPTKPALHFFSDYIGPYAYEKLANIVSPSVGGAMETATAIFYNENLLDESSSLWLRNAIIHEIAHHWFGNSVTEYNWDDAWLSEGFATYFTLLFREYAYGFDDYKEGLLEARRKTIDYYSENPDYQIVADNFEIHGAPTSLATYQKGAWVLHMLRNKIGKDNFRNGIRSYYRRFKNSTAVTRDFINEMELASNQDLDPFFWQWLYQGGIPKLECEWSYNDRSKEISITINQVQSADYTYSFDLSLAIKAQDQSASQLVTIAINERRKSFKIPIEVKPDTITIDPEISLLAKWEIHHKD